MTMQFDEVHNVLRILLNIDYREMEEAGIEFDQTPWASDPPEQARKLSREAGWAKFRDNPHRWFIQASDEDAARVWKIIESRQSAKPQEDV